MYFKMNYLVCRCTNIQFIYDIKFYEIRNGFSDKNSHAAVLNLPGYFGRLKGLVVGRN